MMREAKLLDKYSVELLLLQLEKLRKITLEDGQILVTEMTKKQREILQALNLCAWTFREVRFGSGLHGSAFMRRRLGCLSACSGVRRRNFTFYRNSLCIAPSISATISVTRMMMLPYSAYWFILLTKLASSQINANSPYLRSSARFPCIACDRRHGRLTRLAVQIICALGCQMREEHYSSSS